jgi:hypothetical protein
MGFYGAIQLFTISFKTDMNHSDSARRRLTINTYGCVEFAHLINIYLCFCVEDAKWMVNRYVLVMPINMLCVEFLKLTITSL